MRKFNTSGPNISKKHYTIQRTNLVQKGIELVEDDRYFTIWAPRQTGKSTYFRQLAKKLTAQNYKVAHRATAFKFVKFFLYIHYLMQL